MNAQVLDGYRIHDRMTEPGAYGTLLDALPMDLTALHAALNGVLIHVWKVRTYHPELLAGRSHQVFTRHIGRLLEEAVTLDSRPLDVERPLERRMIVDCRHFATVLCTALRHRGVPARARCGFATYLEDTHFQDHWACEYWDGVEGRWVMEDADLQRHAVPADQFITGAQAWRMAREDARMAGRFGYDAETRGIDVVRTNLVRDLAALHGFPSVSGDAWGLGLTEGTEVKDEDLALLDRAAELVAGGDFEAHRRLYETSEGLRVPDMIQNFDYVVANRWRSMEWRQEP